MPPFCRFKDTVSTVMIYSSSAAERRDCNGDRPARGRWLSPERAEIAGSGRFGLRFRHVGGDRIHQCRGQTIVRLKPKFLEARSDRRHLRWIDAGLDHRGHKRCKLRSGRTTFREQLRMDEVQSVERMRAIFDAAVHMRAASTASMPLDRCRRVDHAKLVAVPENSPIVPWYNG